MIRVPVGGFVIELHDSFNDVEQRTEDRAAKVQETAPFLWAKFNNLKITTHTAYIPHSYTTQVFYYVELTDIQLTEYTLRFL